MCPANPNSATVNFKRNAFIGIFILLFMLNVMKMGDARTIFNQLIPNDTLCPGPGEHGCLCERNVDCGVNKYLECIDGQCDCEFPLHRYFDETLGKCVSLVGSMCTSLTSQGGLALTPECIRNAECDGGRCTCREGFSRTSKNVCKVNFGEECGPNQCNSDRGLACKEGKCACKDSAYVYSVIHANCLDPEQIVRNIVQQTVNRFVQGILNFKRRRVTEVVTAPFRILIRLLLGPIGILMG